MINKENDPEKLPCPFCRSVSVSVFAYENGRRCVACSACFASGSILNSKEEAISNWNSLDRSLAMVAEFHRAFGHPVKGEPDLSDEKHNKLRVELLSEELLELKSALSDAAVAIYAFENGLVSEFTRKKILDATVAAFDALLDIQVVLDGAFLSLGFHRYKAAGLAEVHRSNMSKLGEDGKPIYREDGKILKGPNYTPPNLRKVLWL